MLAVNANGQSDPSDTATGMPSATITGMVQSVTVESESATTAKATVIVSGADVDHPVAVYMRYREKPESDEDNGSNGSDPAVGQIASTQQETEEEWSEVQSFETTDGVAEFTLTDLVADTEYEIQVSLDENFADDVPVSETDFTLASVPAAPTGIVLTPGDAEITVKWDAPADDGGSPVTAYIVRWQPAQAASDPPKQAQVEAADVMYTITGLENDTEYEVHVVAVNLIGESDPSEAANATPTAAAVTTIGLVRIQDVSQTSATAEVTLLNRDDNAVTTVYLRYRATAGQQSWSAVASMDAATDTVEFTLSGLSAGTGYEVQASLDSAFPSDAIVSTSFTTLAAPQPPRITSASVFTVDEGETRVATLTAFDADTPVSQLVWSILPASPDGSKFMLSAGGSLFFRSAKDYENPDDADADGTYELTVQVSDGALTDSAAIRVTLRDVDEQVSPTPVPTQTPAPTPIPTPTQPPAITVNYQATSYSVREGASVSVSVRLSSSPSQPVAIPIRVLAGGTAEQGDYVLTGLVSGALPVAPGQISKSFRVMTNSDTDTDDETVRLGFGQLPRGVSSGNNRVTTITISDDDVAVDTVRRSGGSAVRNSRPRFDERHNAVRSIEENVPVGTEVGAPVSATDADRRDQNSLAYILSGADVNSFSIETGTGQLLTKTELDFETRTDYRVVVVVRDGRGGRDVISVSITVTDVNEPPVLDGARAIEYPENSLAIVGTFTATDPEGDSIASWSLSGDDSAHFLVDDSGSLTFIESPNYEQPADKNSDNNYNVTVKVSDGTGTGPLDVTVVVTDVDDEDQPTPPTASPVPQPTATATLAPTATPVPAPTPTVVPTATATVRPTATPARIPTASPTVAPTEVPTQVPTPTIRPTATTAPAVIPTAAPTVTVVPAAVATEVVVPPTATPQPVAQPPAVVTEDTGMSAALRSALILAAVAGIVIVVLVIGLLVIWRRQRAS